MLEHKNASHEPCASHEDRTDDEVEDIVGDVQYTDSQKSVTTSAVYSQDFTDSSPERQNSFGKQTYVLDCDESDDSESTFQIHHDLSLVNLNEAMVARPDMQQLLYEEINKSIRANFRRRARCFTNEFTQTSKTIIELAQTEIVVHKPTRKSLQTQTSIISLTEHKTLDHKQLTVNDYILDKHDVTHTVINDIDDFRKLFIKRSPHKDTKVEILKENKRLTFVEPEMENKIEICTKHNSEDRIIPFIDDESKESEVHGKDTHETTSEFDPTNYDSDMEEDSLMLDTEYRSSRRSKGDDISDTSEMQKSLESDVNDLYNKLSESPVLLSQDATTEPCKLKYGTLTPLSEESSVKKSCVEVTTSSQTLEPNKNSDSESMCLSNDGVKVKMFSNSASDREREKFKLPPIHKACPNSGHLNFLFSVNTNPRLAAKDDTLPYLYESREDNWENGTLELASGESPLISGRSDPVKTPKDSVHLPPIHTEGAVHNVPKPNNLGSPDLNTKTPESTVDAISIRSRIKELNTQTTNRARARVESRNCSPISNSSRQERLYDVAERGCDNLCAELLRRLRMTSWVQVLQTLEDLVKSLEKYWEVMTVNRTAEILRQVMVHMDSPRTQVARVACTVLAEILKRTNFTRKPDFYEGIAMLLTKTGSFNRPVRRAANVALDDIACGVDNTHTATAICVYGVGHKSALVRCAAARLLVVCCALGEGGRQLLRARPPSVAAARRHVLRALADLLQDRNLDTRKYAERLYAMLRPLPSFEAYFLTDVDVELAARHMKKYDPILIHNNPVRYLSMFS